MSKFKDKVHELSLAVGGSHYPSINAHLQEQMVKLVVDECISALDQTSRKHVGTTFDKDQYEETIACAKRAVKERFGL